MLIAVSNAFEYLKSAQNESGGWGYKTGHRAVVEPTALVLLAIRDEPGARDTFQRGISWLISCQNMDGGWGINEEDNESGWQTAWAIIALQKSNQNSNSVSRAIEWLTTVATYTVSRDEFLKPSVPTSEEIGALAWPWLPAQASWTEPSALAVMALEGLANTPLAVARIKAALDYFEHFRTAGGGWNVGNAGPLDTNVPARVYPTALVLIAQSIASKQAIQSDDISALQNDLKNDQGIMAHGAGLLALQILGINAADVDSYLSKSQLSDGSWENSPFATAWALLGSRGYL